MLLLLHSPVYLCLMALLLASQLDGAVPPTVAASTVGPTTESAISTVYPTSTVAVSTLPTTTASEVSGSDVADAGISEEVSAAMTFNNSTEPQCKANEKSIHDVTSCHVLCSKGALFYYAAGRKANGSVCVVNNYYVASKQIESTKPGECFKGKCVPLNVTTSSEAATTSGPSVEPVTLPAATELANVNTSTYRDTAATLGYNTTELQQEITDEPPANATEQTIDRNQTVFYTPTESSTITAGTSEARSTATQPQDT